MTVYRRLRVIIVGTAKIMDRAQYMYYCEPVLAQVACKGLHECTLPLHACGYWNYKWSLQGVVVCHATSAIWGVRLHGFALCQATSAMGGVRHSVFVPLSHPPPRSKGASVNCKRLQWCTVGSVPLDSPLVWGAWCALRTSGVRDA